MRTKIIFTTLIVVLISFLHQNNFAKDSIGIKERNKSFNDFFEIKKIILLEAGNTIIGSVGDCAVDNDGNIWIADKIEHNVKKYNEDGHLLQIIGREGKGPGEFKAPWGLYISEAGELYVVDPFLSRLSIFKINGEFKTSFKIKDGREVATSSTGEVIIVAAPWLVSEKGGFCIHFYNKKGKELKSFFPISDSMIKSHLLCDRVSFDIDGENNIYCIQESDYTIYKYNLSGQLLKTFSTRASFYKAPPLEPFEETYSRQAITKWTESWTHVVNIEVLNNREVLLVNLLQPRPKKFIIDIYNTGGNFIVGGLTTDWYLIYTDKRDNIYFLQTQETTSGLNYILLKFSLKGI